MGDDPTHQEGVAKIPPQGDPQDHMESNLEREGWGVDIPPPLEEIMSDL